jgi:hypothetical protein
MREFYDHYRRCDNCRETWIYKNTVSFWYDSFYKWVDRK